MRFPILSKKTKKERDRSESQRGKRIAAKNNVKLSKKGRTAPRPTGEELTGRKRETAMVFELSCQVQRNTEEGVSGPRATSRPPDGQGGGGVVLGNTVGEGRGLKKGGARLYLNWTRIKGGWGV